MTLHEQIVLAYQNYIRESENFDSNDVKVSAVRARQALLELNKLTTLRRQEIQQRKKDL